MPLIALSSTKFFAAMLAPQGLQSCVSPLVLHESIFGFEGFFTDRAGIRPLVGVDTLVVHHVAVLSESTPTDLQIKSSLVHCQNLITVWTL